MTQFARLLLFFGLVTLSCFAHAEITNVAGSEVSIRLNGKSVVVGQQLDVLDSTGRKIGVLEITQVTDSSAKADLITGVAYVGMKVAKRSTVFVENNSSPAAKSKNTFNFRANPIGLIGGGVDANLDFRIGNEWTIGLQGIYLHLKLPASGDYTSDYDISAYGAGVRTNWSSNGAFKDGYYVGASLEYLSVNLKTTDVFGAATGTASGVMASGLVGYGWFWDHFNIMLGGGYGTVLGSSGITIKDTIGRQETITASLSGLTYELSIGWAF